MSAASAVPLMMPVAMMTHVCSARMIFLPYNADANGRRPLADPLDYNLFGSRNDLTTITRPQPFAFLTHIVFALWESGARPLAIGGISTSALSAARGRVFQQSAKTI